MVKLLVRMGMLLLSLLFWIAAKLRLTLPLLYILVVGISTVFSDFVRRNEQAVLLGLPADINVISYRKMEGQLS